MWVNYKPEETEAANQPPGACFPWPTAAARRRIPRCPSPSGDLRITTQHTKTAVIGIEISPSIHQKQNDTHLAHRSRPAAAPSLPLKKTEEGKGAGLSRQNRHQIRRRCDRTDRRRLPGFESGRAPRESDRMENESSRIRW